MSQSVPLSRILDHLGETLLRLESGDDLVHGVQTIVIHDPRDGLEIPEDSMVLAVGVSAAVDIESLLEQCADGRRTVVLRAPLELSSELRSLARDRGIALLSLAPRVSWSHLVTLLNSLLARVCGEPEAAEPLAGIAGSDLFAVANAISALVDAPITIEDVHSRVLAFSSNQEQADQSRIETVLGRQVPERYLRVLEERGVFRELRRSQQPVFTPIDQDSYPEICMPRVAVSVRAGNELLGSIWAAVSGPLDPRHEAAMVDGAKVAALHLLRMRANGDVERRLRSRLVAALLEGGPAAVEAAARLGLQDRSVIVCALGLGAGAAPAVSSDAHRELALERVADAFGLHLSSVRPGSVVAPVADVVYGILPVTGPLDGAERDAVRQAGDFMERAGDRLVGRVGVGRPATEVAVIWRSRSDADLALRVLRTSDLRRRAASLAELQTEALVLQLSDFAASEQYEFNGPLTTLSRYDAEHGGELVATLRSWLDAFGNIAVAAERAHVHPNTFRYRLRRICELSGVDLDDPEARFAIMLQLRVDPALRSPTPTSAGVTAPWSAPAAGSRP